MKSTDSNSKKTSQDQLLHSIRTFTRSSLLLQSAIAAKAGLNVTDAECIDFLMEMGPSTAGDLARATMLTTGAITSMIDRLTKAGLVRREKDPADRRKVIVRFLPKKHEQTGKHYTALSNEVKEFIGNYSQKELDFLNHHMQRLQEIFDRNTNKVTQM